MFATTLLVAIWQSTIASHPKLQTLTSYDRPLTHVQDLLKEISEQTGLDIRATNNLWDIKLDLYTKDKPIGETLNSIAELIDGTWEPTSLGFVLKQSAKRQELEKSYLQAEEDFARQNAALEIDVCRRIAQLIPASESIRLDAETLAYHREQKTTGISGGGDTSFFTDFRPQSDQANAAYQKALKSGASNDQLRELEVEAKALKSIAGGQPPLVKSRLLSQLTAKELDAYKKGLPFACSTTFEGRFRVHLGDNIGGFTSFKKGEPIATKTFGITQIDPETFELVYVQYAFAEGSAGIGGGPQRTTPVVGVPSALADHPFMKSVRAWDQTATTRNDWKQPISTDPKAAWVSPYFTKGFRFGDHLRWLHRTSGVSVIALADRNLHPWLKLERQYGSVGDYLQGFAAANGASVRKSGDFLLARNSQFWRKRQYELPESWFKRLEGRQNLTTSDYAKASLPLTNAQAKLLTQTSGFLATFDSTPFEGALLGLKMFGSLNDSQAQKALNGGVLFSELTRDQLALAQYTIIQAVLNGNFVPEKFLLEVIERGNSAATYQGMSFAVEPNRKNTIMRGGTTLTDGTPVEIRPDKDYSDSKMTDFTFYRNGARILQMHGYTI